MGGDREIMLIGSAVGVARMFGNEVVNLSYPVSRGGINSLFEAVDHSSRM